MSASPRDLLAALLQLYWAEGVTQERAAKLLGIAKATFAELADLRLVKDGLERVARDYYLEQFNYRFPECDQRCAAGKARAHDGGKERDAYAKEPTRRECALDARCERSSRAYTSRMLR